mgnify:CR=1 FL=1
MAQLEAELGAAHGVVEQRDTNIKELEAQRAELLEYVQRQSEEVRRLGVCRRRKVDCTSCQSS